MLVLHARQLKRLARLADAIGRTFYVALGLSIDSQHISAVDHHRVVLAVLQLITFVVDASHLCLFTARGAIF